MVGSVNYMAPEQISGDKATTRSDIYSVGVTLYEILTGKLPVSGTNNFEIMRSHLNDRATPPVELNPQLPLALSNAILKSLEKNPEERFASAHDFLAALNAVSVTAMGEALSVATTAFHVSGSSAQRQQKSGSQAAQFPLDDVSKKLAVYIGPIASIVVRKLAAKCSDLDQLYKEAATQIASEADRQKFLQSKRR
jgi:serine/threonine-protein kinase